MSMVMNLMNFQDASCFLSEEMIFFHDYSLLFLVLITSVVFFLMSEMISAKIVNRFLLHNESIEFIWIVLPSIFLFFIALPSLHLLYLFETEMSPQMTLKVTGHQWYWEYEYPEFESNSSFNSFMLKPLNTTNTESEKENSFYRSLDTDFRVVLPMKKVIRVITTSDDVIHSWTVPVLGVKMDSVPGRLNQFSIESERPGVFFGQCSEICGILHSFMPIVIEVVDIFIFIKWISDLLD